MTSKKSVARTRTHKMIKWLLVLTIMAFFVATVVAISTTQMSNNQTNGGVFGSFDSTGSALVLIGFPWLALQYLRHLQEM